MFRLSTQESSQITNENSEDALKILIRNFYNNSLHFQLQPHEIEWLTWDKQKTFLDTTVHNKILIKYPVSREFSRLFFKRLISYLEPVQEIHDEFYTFLCSVLTNSSKEDFCNRHYVVGDDFEDFITIKETKNMVVNGTTGMKTWQAALMLADWILNNDKMFDGKKILELGSGVGFTGIAVAKKCNIHSIVLSDCHTDVLKVICENVQINFPHMKLEENGAKKVYRDESKQIGIMMLDWNCIEDLPNDTAPDILIGADIIYDPTILKPLCNAIKTFFDKNKNLNVFIANEIRNKESYEGFLEILDSMNLTYEQITQPRNVLFQWDSNIQRCLLKIKLNG